MDVTHADDEAADVGDLDLRPRSAPSPKGRRVWAIVVIVLILGALAFVATKALSDAALFFYNADEAVAKHDQLGDSRFRLQGTVEDGTINATGDGVDFTVTFNGAEVAVHHRVIRRSCSRPANRWCSRGVGTARSMSSTATACS